MIDKQMFEDRVPVSLSQGHQREVVTLIHCWPPPRGSLDCKRAETPRDWWQSTDDPAGEST